MANYATYDTHLMLSSYFCPRHPTVETLLPVGFYTPKITRLVILDWTAREYLRSKAMIDPWLPLWQSNVCAFKQGVYIKQKEFKTLKEEFVSPCAR